MFVDRGSALPFDLPHLRRVVVVLGERPVDVRHVEVVPVRDRARIQPAVFDLLFDEPDGDPPALEVGFVGRDDGRAAEGIVRRRTPYRLRAATFSSAVSALTTS